MNAKRWKELRDLEKNNPEELERIGREVAAQVGIIFAKDRLTAVDVMCAENKRDYPENIKNIHDWIQ